MSKNCSIETTAPCDADCVNVYSMTLLPNIMGRNSTRINGPLLLVSADAVVVGSLLVVLKIMAAFLHPDWVIRARSSSSNA